MEPTRGGRGRGVERKLLAYLLVTNFFEARDLIGLGAFGPLDDVEFDLVAFFEALIALTLDGTVMNEDVGPTLPPEEAVALCVVEPLDGAFVLCQWSCSL